MYHSMVMLLVTRACMLTVAGRVWWPGRWLPPDPASLSSFRPRFRVADWQSGCREVNRARRAGGHTAEAPRGVAAARQVQGVGLEKPCREISLCLRKVDFVPGDCERLNHVRWSCTEICAVCHLLDVFLCIVFFYIAVFLYLIWERLSRSDIKLTSFLYKV